MECDGKGQTMASDIEQSECSSGNGRQCETVINPQKRLRKEESQHEVRSFPETAPACLKNPYESFVK